MFAKLKSILKIIIKNIVSEPPINKQEIVIKTNLILLKIKKIKKVKNSKDIIIAKIKELITTFPAKSCTTGIPVAPGKISWTSSTNFDKFSFSLKFFTGKTSILYFPLFDKYLSL